MNTKIGTVVLIIACLGLAIVLVVVKKQASDQQTKAVSDISTLSNQLVGARDEINGLNQVNLSLRATNEAVAAAFSNDLAQASNELGVAASALQTAQQQITNLNDRITDLETQNRTLDQRAKELTNAIAALDEQIALTQKKLNESDRNNAFLAAELKRQIDEKAELERKFNNLQAVRAQVKKLREDLLVARRLEWMREGIDPTKPMKGGQLLMQKTLFAPSAAKARPPASLNVEVNSDGSVRVLPPPTNPPAH